MIQKRTLLVLGAGASAPFGFPVGSQLRHRIISINAENVLAMGIELHEFEPFRNDFRHSGLSIDAFLARRPEFDDLGRAAIVHALLPFEADNLLFNVNSVPGASDWYQALWLKMVRDVLDEPSRLLDNRLRVITFNYDRSFERYLHLAAQATFGLPQERAFELIQPFFPYHVYGDLGEYTSNNWGGGITADSRRHRISRLKVMPSTRPPEDEICHKQFTWAEQVFFLGFAFDPMNCARLGFSKAIAAYRREGVGPPLVAGTTHGLSPYERHLADLAVTGGPEHAMIATAATCVDAMREWAPYLDS